MDYRLSEKIEILFIQSDIFYIFAFTYQIIYNGAITMAVENDCNIFLDLMRCEVKGQPYWLDRDLQKAFGYSSFQKFSAIVNKAKKDIEAEGLDMNNHFNQLDKMQEIGSGAKRRIVVTMLSGHACLHIAELADKRKESVQLARSFFCNNDFTLKGEHCKYLTLAIDKDKRDIQRRNILYWKRLTDHASEFYIAKMKKLDGVRSVKRDDTFHGHKAPFHLMYKLKTIIHEGRGYEFLIEYKIDEPTVGIYYGVKGLIMDGDDDHQINEFNKEWETLEGTVTYYLNAVFPGKDFSVRYKPTNNANDHTYWPFWITLYEDEDIIKVGLRALKIISKIYQEYFKNGGKNLISYKPDKDTKASSQIETVTAFTEDAYHALETKIPSAMLTCFIHRMALS